jgi:hypothetical protein
MTESDGIGMGFTKRLVEDFGPFRCSSIRETLTKRQFTTQPSKFQLKRFLIEAKDSQVIGFSIVPIPRELEWLRSSGSNARRAYSTVME